MERENFAPPKYTILPNGQLVQLDQTGRPMETATSQQTMQQSPTTNQFTAMNYSVSPMPMYTMNYHALNNNNISQRHPMLSNDSREVSMPNIVTTDTIRSFIPQGQTPFAQQQLAFQSMVSMVPSNQTAQLEYLTGNVGASVPTGEHAKLKRLSELALRSPSAALRTKRSHSASFHYATSAKNESQTQGIKNPPTKQLKKKSKSSPAGTLSGQGETFATPVSDFRGVSYHRRDKKWTARTWLHGKMVHIGMFKQEKMAALMVDIRNLRVLGDGCHKKMNFTPKVRIALAEQFALERGCPQDIVE
eukprot:CAMPEP_0203759392 /NCGR_PEP_ID=MMETSP0098-20131031/12395_1 /ASSEMBLY_ACC=CAM_ASM_000208 /TAXON_ID=96639 /ORGANISM=" , Strain NY0313808BC1" /LENGTH=303 /DNA_ID=CAMNT_0050652307 /DNA_START=1089 /DNA_END=1997 /DNA_ORIENTATION=+